MSDFAETIQAMIAEQGEVWLGSGADRTFENQAVVVTDDPARCWRLVHGPLGWAVSESTLTTDELANFFAAFGSHWRTQFGSRVMCGTTEGEKPYRVRAFIKNGRKHSQQWSISLGSVEGSN